MVPPVLPTRDDPLVARSSESIGGPAGSRVLAWSGWWTPLRIMLAMVFLVSAFGYLSKWDCRERAWGSSGGENYIHLCYSDTAPLYSLRGLAAGAVPYLNDTYQAVEYPVLTGAFMYVTALGARTAVESDVQTRRYFDINAVLLALCAAVAVAATMHLAGRRPWDAAILALAPVLALAGTINWDLFAVALTALAMLAWARRNPVWAGVLFGLGAAAKLYPAFLLGPLFVLCLRAGRLPEFGRTVTAAAGTWLVVNVPVMVFGFQGWSEFYRLNEDRGADLGSIWYALEKAGYKVPALNVISAGDFLILCTGIALLTLAAPRRPRLPQLAFLTLAAFLLTNKVYSPQYVLWMLPLVALARPRWRDVIIWQACEIVYFLGIWYHLASFHDADHGLPDRVYVLSVVIRVAGTLYLVFRVIGDILWPDRDVVRADGSDDPAGGALDGAPDVVTISSLSIRSRSPGQTA